MEENNNVEVTPSMEQPEKKKSTAVIIVLLILIIMGLIGFICYKEFYKKEPAKPVEKGVNKEEKNDMFVGSYSYKGEYVDIVDNLDDETLNDHSTWSSGKMAYEELKINADGSAEATAGNENASGYSAKGNWHVEDNKLIIVDDECQKLIDENGDANCNPRWEYIYKIDGDMIYLTSNNNSITTVTLSKTS
jgi:hypothetical protein